jgi:hypothetical protein
MEFDFIKILHPVILQHLKVEARGEFTGTP